jgi:hypothetical protein
MAAPFISPTCLSRGDCAITKTGWLRIESQQRCDVAGVGAMWDELARDRRFLWRAQLCGRSTTASPPHLGGQARRSQTAFKMSKNIDATPDYSNRTQSCARTTRNAGPAIQARVSQKAYREGPPLLNSACRHCISPRRGRRVEWSGPRRGSECLHFRAHRICRRCASDASQESVGDPGSIDVTTNNNPFVIDAVKRCKGRSRIIES